MKNRNSKPRNGKSRRWLANIGIGLLVLAGLWVWVKLPWPGVLGLAVLKTIGFSNRSVLWLVLVEAVVLVVLGGVIGLGLAAVLMPFVSAASGGMIQLPSVLPQTWLLGLGLMLLIGAIGGVLPALRAMRLNIGDALAGR
jgi:hypothetical protein